MHVRGLRARQERIDWYHRNLQCKSESLRCACSRAYARERARSSAKRNRGAVTQIAPRFVEYFAYHRQQTLTWYYIGVFMSDKKIGQPEYTERRSDAGQATEKCSRRKNRQRDRTILSRCIKRKQECIAHREDKFI